MFCFLPILLRQFWLYCLFFISKMEILLKIPKICLFGQNRNAFHHHWLFLDVNMKNGWLCVKMSLTASAISFFRPPEHHLRWLWKAIDIVEICYSSKSEKVKNIVFSFFFVSFCWFEICIWAEIIFANAWDPGQKFTSIKMIFNMQISAWKLEHMFIIRSS